LLVVYFSRTVTPTHQAPLEAVKPLVQPQPQPRQEFAGGSTPIIKVPDRSPRAPQAVQEKEYTLEVQDRPAVFPTPMALSDQEKFFLRYLAGTPKDEVIAQSHSDEGVDGLPEDQSALPVRQSVTRGTR
jgi:hypothetical protein